MENLKPYNLRKIIARKILNVLLILVMVLAPLLVSAEPDLTKEEKEYIKNKGILKAGSLEGVAPHNYTDSKGNIRGISFAVLNHISDITGLEFEYKLYNSIEEIYNSGSDIFFGISPIYAPEDMALSKSFLSSGSILFINSAIDKDNLEDNIFAGIKNGPLPEGVNKDKVICYKTREDTVKAVNRGEADYGYGNGFSIAYYILQNNFKNIVTIPTMKESREYSIGVTVDKEILIPIINKALDSIDENQMQNITLSETSRIDRQISYSMIMDAYGGEIFSIVIFSAIVLLINIYSSISANKKLKMQNRRFEILASISNEYIFEYYFDTGDLELSEKFIKLFNGFNGLNMAKKIIKDDLLYGDAHRETFILEIPIDEEETIIFKAINSIIYDDKGKVYSIIGKLIDISEDMAEKEKLIIKAQLDGLTGLLNKVTTTDLVIKSMNIRPKEALDALIIMDCDKFKNINDTLGHLTGDQVLINVSKGLKITFRESDIIGRIGGDEFLVYVKNIPSVDFIYSKCKQLNQNIQIINQEFHISVSIGVAILKEDISYEDLFESADKALYQAKKNGTREVVIFSK